MIKNKMEIVFPGDSICYAEEYEGTDNTFDDNEVVRSTAIGTIDIDKKHHLLKIINRNHLILPKNNDIIIGRVISVMSSMIIVSIEYINNDRIYSKLECVCYTRNIRKKIIALLNDVVKLKIINYKNGAIHANIEENEMGVLFTKCRKCGGEVISNRGGIKCIECSWVDERKVSVDFGSSEFIKIKS